jgi:hypothetical protein
MRRETHSDNSNYFDSGKSFHGLGTQPRRSGFPSHKSAQFADDAFDDGGNGHHRYRDEPNKKMVRVQLRRIERLF